MLWFNKPKDKEWATSDKINWWFSTAVQWGLSEKMPYKLDRFADFDIATAQDKFKNKIEAVLIDIDDCIAPAYWEIIEENVEKIKELLSMWIKVWVLSNGINIDERCKILTDLWVEICESKYSKPSLESYILACEQLWVSPENTIMIGDDISKDGWALRLDKNWKPILLWYVPVIPIWNSYENIPKWKKLEYMWKEISRALANKRNWL